MASRRPTDTLRGPDVPKEIPRVIKADEKAAATVPTRKTPVPRARKAAAKTTTAKTTTAKTSTRAEISEDARRGMIAEGAYLRSERRGFAPGFEEEDWLAAEAEVNALLKAGHGGTSQ